MKRIRIWALALALAIALPCARALGEGSGVLMRESSRFAAGADGTSETSVLGNGELERSRVRSVTFLDALEGAPEGAWDVSEARDGSVLAWSDPPVGERELYLFAVDDDHAEVGEAPDSDYALYIAADGGVKANPDSQGLFAGYGGLETVSFGGCFDTSQVENLRGMFSDCGNLLRLDLSGFDTSRALDMSELFSGCRALKELDLSSFDSSYVRSMSGMFYGCEALLRLDLSSLDTSAVEDMSSMFGCCFALEKLDLSGFDTRSATDMSCMFDSCGLLRELDLSGFDLSAVRSMRRMFADCPELRKVKVDQRRFQVPVDADREEMFENSGLYRFD